MESEIPYACERMAPFCTDDIIFDDGPGPGTLFAGNVLSNGWETRMPTLEASREGDRVLERCVDT